MTPGHFLFGNKLYMFKETYGLSPETKMEKVVITTAPSYRKDQIETSIADFHEAEEIITAKDTD